MNSTYSTAKNYEQALFTFFGRGQVQADKWSEKHQGIFEQTKTEKWESKFTFFVHNRKRNR